MVNSFFFKNNKNCFIPNPTFIFHALLEHCERFVSSKRQLSWSTRNIVIDSNDTNKRTSSNRSRQQ